MLADEDYEIDRTVGAKIGSAAMRKAVQSAYRPAATLLHVHTHGGHGKPGFSAVDLNSAKESCRASSRPRRGCRTAFWCSATTRRTGSSGWPTIGRRSPLTSSNALTRPWSASGTPMTWLDRQSFLGVDSDARLAAATVGLVGLGGGNSHVVQQLAHLGLGGFVLLDDDIITLTNLNRLVGGSWRM